MSDLDVDEDRVYRWEITPHPYSSDYDMYVTDDDQRALVAVQNAAEQAWDRAQAGGVVRTITIKLNRAKP